MKVLTNFQAFFSFEFVETIEKSITFEKSSSFFLFIDASSKEIKFSEFDKSTFLLFCLVIPT